MTTETIDTMSLIGGDDELFRLRCKAKYVGDHLTRDQEIRIALVDGFLHTIDEILDDRAAHRVRSIVLTPMWRTEEG